MLPHLWAKLADTSWYQEQRENGLGSFFIPAIQDFAGFPGPTVPGGRRFQDRLSAAVTGFTIPEISF